MTVRQMLAAAPTTCEKQTAKHKIARTQNQKFRVRACSKQKPKLHSSYDALAA